MRKNTFKKKNGSQSGFVGSLRSQINPISFVGFLLILVFYFDQTDMFNHHIPNQSTKPV